MLRSECDAADVGPGVDCGDPLGQPLLRSRFSIHEESVIYSATKFQLPLLASSCDKFTTSRVSKAF
jgi:hypothetical protein